jgi:hypothetical protein
MGQKMEGEKNDEGIIDVEEQKRLGKQVIECGICCEEVLSSKNLGCKNGHNICFYCAVDMFKRRIDGIAFTIYCLSEIFF